jgi:hypothetical protein
MMLPADRPKACPPNRLEVDLQLFCRLSIFEAARYQIFHHSSGHAARPALTD